MRILLALTITAVLALAAPGAAQADKVDDLNNWLASQPDAPGDFQLTREEFNTFLDPDTDNPFWVWVEQNVHAKVDLKIVKHKRGGYVIDYKAANPGQPYIKGQIYIARKDGHWVDAPFPSRCGGMIGHFTVNSVGACIPHSILGYTAGDRAGQPYIAGQPYVAPTPRDCTVTIGKHHGHDHSC